MVPRSLWSKIDGQWHPLLFAHALDANRQLSAWRFRLAMPVRRCTAIVNHTSNNGLGELICTGVNQNSATGNPTLHREIVAISNCTSILADPIGPYKLSPSEASSAWADLTLYTNAESCPMCASAIRWAGFKEYVYGTSIERLIETGWGQIDIASSEVFMQNWNMETNTRYIPEMLTNETDPFFLWQFQPEYPCPEACDRNSAGGCESS